MTARANRVRRREAEVSESNRIRAGVPVEQWALMTSGQRRTAVDQARKQVESSLHQWRVSNGSAA